MTVVICTIFYIYVIIAVNYYRKEIVKRANDGYTIKGKVRAPYPIKVMVLFAATALAANIFVFLLAGNDDTILINTLPVLFFVNLLWRYERRIKRIDREND